MGGRSSKWVGGGNCMTMLNLQSNEDAGARNAK